MEQAPELPLQRAGRRGRAESLALEYGITNFPAPLGCFPQRNFFRILSFTATIQRAD